MVAEFDTSVLEVALRRRSELEAQHRQASLDLAYACQSASDSGMTLKQVGEVLGITKQAVSQLVGKAVAQDRLDWEESQEGSRWDSWSERAQAKDESGLVRRSFPCESCGKFKRRPADECPHCGSTLLTHNGNAANLNRAYGYAA